MIFVVFFFAPGRVPSDRAAPLYSSNFLLGFGDHFFRGALVGGRALVAAPSKALERPENRNRDKEEKNDGEAPQLRCSEGPINSKLV